jgi:cyclic pyranopterin monophosphate synthase
MGELTHLDDEGHARMVDVAGKDVTDREAVATCRVRLTPTTARLLVEGGLPKGDALPVARIAGIQAAKRTPELLPLCHQVALTSVEVDITVDVEGGTADITATARASVAALTLYDLCKSVQKDVVVTDLRLRRKRGGRSGDLDLP